MKRGIRLPLMALVAGVMAIAVVAWPSAASALDKLTLKLAWTPYGPQGFLHLPVVNGWFKDAGLDVEIEDGAGSNKTIAYIGAKNYDIGFANVSSMAMAREKGLEVKVIMLMVRQSDFGVLVPKEKNVKTLKDIERLGLGIGYTAASMEGAFMDTFLKLGGTNRSKVKLVNIDPSAKISSYLSGTVDTILTSAPFIEPILRTKKPSTIVSFAQVGLPLPSNGVMAHVDTIAGKKDQLRRFVKVVSRSVEYVMSGGGEDESVDAIFKQRPNAKLDRWLLREQINTFRPHYFSPNTKGKPMGWQSPEDWAATIKVMQDAGALPKSRKPDEYYTNEFFEGMV
jgi:NitT/TauT family transport system substrate-binding protein